MTARLTMPTLQLGYRCASRVACARGTFDAPALHSATFSCARDRAVLQLISRAKYFKSHSACYMHAASLSTWYVLISKVTREYVLDVNKVKAADVMSAWAPGRCS